MNHLLSPLDFSTEELDALFDLADDIEKILKSMPIPVPEKNWLPVFMSRVQGQG